MQSDFVHSSSSVDPVSSVIVLDVILHKGGNLKKTFWEKLKHAGLDNTVDPYISFEVTDSLGIADDAVQKSSIKENEENPVWEEELTFLLNSSKPGRLQMTLWDSNYLFDSQMSNPVFVDLNGLTVGEKYQRRTMTIHKTGFLEISLRLRKEEEFEIEAIDYSRPETLEQGELDKKLYAEPYIVRLDVIIHSARDLKKSFYRKVSGLFGYDKLNPFVKLHVTNPWEKAKDAEEQRTVYRSLTDKPEWEEEVSFLIDNRNGAGQLKLTLCDSCLLTDRRLSGPHVVDLDTIGLGLKFEEREENMGDGGMLKYSIRMRKPTADVRIGQDLHKKEEEIVKQRRKNAAKNIKTLLGQPKNSKAPSISLIGSGGGFRAMIGVSGAMEALDEAGLLDCCTYMSSLSGSTWYLSVLYALRESMDINKCKDYVRERCSSMSPVMKVRTVKHRFGEVEKKDRDGLHVSGVDIWGSLLGQVLQPDMERKQRTRLCDAQRRVESCQFPFPIYTAVTVKRHTPEEVYAEWLEFTPFEYGIHNLKIFTAIENISSERSYGIVSRRYQQFNVPYLQGLWGSAFGGQVRTWITQLASGAWGMKAFLIAALKKVLDWTGVDDLRPFAATIPNFTKGVECTPQRLRALPLAKNYLFKQHYRHIHGIQKSADKKQNKFELHARLVQCGSKDEEMYRNSLKKEDRLTVVDAGLDFNLPFPPLLRPERHTDIFLTFDYSWYGSTEKSPLENVWKAMKWAHNHSYKFPEVREDMFDPKNPKEYYIFEDADPDCPIVILFCLCNSRRQVDPYSPVYSTFNFDYTVEDVVLLQELCHDNTLLAIDVIKDCIRKKMKV